ncbi:hypothetical protein J6590_014932 [Homalodisca vitripennis]|nr:hypothetical protein J6590_014932 [Homalodisca vitripennis]
MLASSQVFQCTQCLRRYKNPSSLSRHVRLECGDMRQFSCPVATCRYQSRRNYYIRLHVLRVHKPTDIS